MPRVDRYIVVDDGDDVVLRFVAEDPAYYFRDGERWIGDDMKPRGHICNWTPFLSRAMRMTREEAALLVAELRFTNNHHVRL